MPHVVPNELLARRCIHELPVEIQAKIVKDLKIPISHRLHGHLARWNARRNIGEK